MVRVIEVCVVLQNMLIRMVYSGNVHGDEDGCDLIQELYEEDRELKESAEAEGIVRNQEGTVGKVSAEGFDNYVEGVMIREFMMTSRTSFLSFGMKLLGSSDINRIVVRVCDLVLFCRLFLFDFFSAFACLGDSSRAAHPGLTTGEGCRGFGTEAAISTGCGWRTSVMLRSSPLLLDFSHHSRSDNV